MPTEYDTDVDRWSLEIAQFESQTKEDYEWRRTWASTATREFIVDGLDKLNWEESTIFTISEETLGGRTYLVGHVGFRVYRSHGKKMKKDERGDYDGWGDKYDEHIPLFSPRIQKHLTHVNGGWADYI